MDGVIIDSEHIHHELERQMFARLGIDVTPEEHQSFTGQTVWSMWSVLKDRYRLPYSVEELRALKKSMFDAELNSPSCRVKLVAGVEALIGRIRQEPVLLAVASSSSLAHVRHMMAHFGLGQNFDGLFGGDLVERSKPAPDLFLHAARQLGVDPAECLVVEDSANGVRAGKAAGMKVIGFRNANSGAQDLSAADLTIDNYGEFPYISA